MISGFKDDDTANVFHGQPIRKAQMTRGEQRIARRKLMMLDAAESLQDLRVPPGNRLEKLEGDREGQWSIRINSRWRLCFVWREHDAHEVQIVDYD